MLDSSNHPSLASSTVDMLDISTAMVSVQDSGSSTVRIVVGGQSHSATGLSPHPDYLKQRHAETEDKMNRAEYRMYIAEITGVQPNEDPNNNQQYM